MSNRSQFDSRRGGPPPARDLRQASSAAAGATSPELMTLFGQAVALHQAGRLMEAEPLYHKVLQAHPRHFDALHLIGVIHYQRGEYDQAVRRIDQALKINPNVAAAHNNRGSVLKGLGRPKEALASYDRAIALKPDYADAFYNRGNVLRSLARFEEAVASYDRAIALRPGYPDACNNRGSALKELGRFDDAIASFDRALALKPDYAEAWYNRANALNELKRFDEALEGCDRAIALKPDLAEAFNNRANALKSLRRFEEAVESYDHALALRSDYADALNNRGNALKELKRFQEALDDYDRAIALKPDYAEAFFNRGIALAELKRNQEALASYEQAVALKPDHAEAYFNRGSALLALRRLDEATESFRRALALKPDQDHLKGIYLHAQMHLCEWSDFERLSTELNSDIANGLATTYPFQLLACASTAEAQLECARIFVAHKCPAYPEPLWRGERYAHDRIRIAYVSADLRDHPVAYLIAGLFERHDRSRFETIAISFGDDKPGAIRDRLKASFERFIDADGMNDREVAKLMRALEVDIAVDLNGLTDGSRPDVFAYKPAPAQVNYLGYAGTLGQDYCDYIIADRFVIPEGARAHYAEKVVYLPDSFMVNDSGRKISGRTPSRVEAGLPEKGFVFCCFNNAYKITPDVFDAWMRLLGQIDSSVLWLSSSNAHAPNNLRREAEKRGVAGDRLVFAPRAALNEDHLARVRLADLFLDTLYYNAHTTAADALWAGVPVLTYPGGTFASRVAGSLLAAIGLPELIVGSLAEYENLALQLARDPARLAGLRHKLAFNRDTFPLFDTSRFARHIEAAYTTMWERAGRGEPPESFAVSPVQGRRT
jgi:predicted O-linked N-acetylglucosamine transferase (SPINDLY family)